MKTIFNRTFDVTINILKIIEITTAKTDQMTPYYPVNNYYIKLENRAGI